jgi:hypothetical protein
MEEKPLPEIEISPDYIARMQKEGMWAAQYQEPPEFPECPYYMMGYNSVK